MSNDKKARGSELEDFVLAAEITEGADIGDDEGGGEAVFGADLAEVDAAVFEGQAAATAVVADLDELILQDFVGEIVADAGGEIESAAGEIAVAEEGADLAGERSIEGDDAELSAGGRSKRASGRRALAAHSGLRPRRGAGSRERGGRAGYAVSA